MTYLQIRISMVLLLVEIQYMKYFSLEIIHRIKSYLNQCYINNKLPYSILAIDEIGLE